MKGIAIVHLLLVLGILHLPLQVTSNLANNLDENLKALSEANIKFSVDFYKSIVEDDKTVNVMFSPFSITSALALTRVGAKGNSAKEIEAALNFQDLKESQINSAFGELSAKLFQKDITSNMTLIGANGVFHDKTLSLKEDFRTSLAYYDSKTIPINFKKAADSIKTINDFISTTTEGKIIDMLEDDSVNPDSKMMLVNTLYFKGNWEKAFNMQMDTRDFFVSHYRVITTTFMYQRGKFNFGYVDELSLQILELPYQGNVSMIILLPDNFDLDSVEKNLNYENLTRWLDSTAKQTVDVTIPKFNLSESLDAKNHLMNLGVKDIFDANKADLSGISGGNEFFVSDVLHKGILEFKEDGNLDYDGLYSPDSSDEMKIVYADHPFIFIIRDQTTGAFISMGAVKNVVGKLRNHDEL